MTEFKNFTKVYDTPIVHEPFLSILRQDGLSLDAEQILKGINVLPPCIHPKYVKLFKDLKMDEAIANNAEIKLYTKFPLFCSFWKKRVGREFCLQCQKYIMGIMSLLQRINI